MQRQVKDRFFLILIGAFAFSSEALELTESFDDLSRRASSTAVWNSVSGELHPPLFVKDYFLTAFDDRNFIVGQGEHGAFIPSRYAEFSEGGDVSGNIIRLNTDTYPNLYVTRFELAAGWTLRPVGSRALSVHSLSDIVIYGSLDCSGGDGQAIQAPNTSTPQGGTGRCGGANGGNGASSTTASQAGFNGGPILTDGESVGVDGPTAGGAAAHDGAGAGGGGGGAYQARGIGQTDSTAGGNGGGTGGGRGAMAANHDFSVEGGGFGGGGGDYSANSAGGGGGAGGGQIFLFAVGNIDVHSGAEVKANGGDGGGGDGPGGVSNLTAGGGGGGGGGSILMFAGGDVRLAGQVRALGGSGGQDDGQAGGAGADGRSWLVGSSGFSQALPPDPFVQELPDYKLGAVGSVRYQTGTDFVATSQAYDLLNTRPTLESLSLDQQISGASQITVEWASGETSNFSPSVWNALSTPLNESRYIRFRVTLNNQDDADPARLRALTVDYSPYSQTEFEFAGGCGRVVHRPPSTGSQTLLWFFCCLPVILIFLLRRNGA